MTRHISRYRAITAAVAFAAVASCLLLGRSSPPVPQELGGADRYLTHVSTDKPVYRPGERLYVRAAILRGDTHAPQPAEPHGAACSVDVRGPKGDTVASGIVGQQDGVAGFAWDIPAATPGGEYTVKVSPTSGAVPGERKFDIRAYRAPRLKNQTVFLRDGYGPGDAAGATLHTERAEGGIPAGAKVTVVARVDGTEIHRSETRVDDAGNCSARFELPETIARGEGTLAWIIEDGGVVETATKTIPILLQTVDLKMYPEGGDLIAGLPARVYVEAFTPAKKPADLAGVIVDGDGKEVAAFKTEHEGRGRFAFQPAKGGRYTLKINEPAGIKTTYALPDVKERGAVIHAMSDVTEKGEAVGFKVFSTVGGTLRLTLSKREVELSSAKVTFSDAAPVGGGHARVGGSCEVRLTPPASADGVLIATLWDQDDKPLAERLVFRQPEKSVNVTIAANKSSYVPGERVTLDVITTDADGKPVSAVVGVTVTDDSVLEIIEKREQAPRLPVMVLLESDVRELADAEVYLDKSNSKAPLATDLLLGTQGWRRFAFVEREKFVRDHGQAARRVLALNVVTRREQEREWAAFLAEDVDRAGPLRAAAPAAETALPPQPAAPAPEDGAVANVAIDAKDNGAAPGENGQAAADPAAPQQQAPASGPEALGKAQAAQELGRQLEEAEAKADAVGLIDARRDRDEARKRAARNDFVTIREYSHSARPDRKPGDRVDFAETLCWHAGIKTDAKTGRGGVSFMTSDAVTAFRVSADAFTADGALGSGSSSVQSVQPFYIEPKVPLQVTSGDVIDLPVALVNGTSSELAGATLKASGAPGITFSAVEALTLKPGERVRRLLGVNVGEYVGTSDIVLDAIAAGGYADKVTRKLDVRPLGFPIEVAFGGMIGPDGAAVVSHTIEIPEQVVANSVSSDLGVYPTPLANMTQALESLLQSPNGCFEQTSSTTYPLVMAQQYFMSHAGVDPSLIERSRKLLDDGYQRLIGFECKTTKGFEWFGSDPGHEALSAYGLLEFTDMAQVRDVDARMLADTRAFVTRCRDGKGGFKRERPTLHTWIADPECSNGYITWALLECGERGLDKEVAWLKDAAGRSSNSYAVALAANVMSLAGDSVAAKSLMDKLASKQVKDGHVGGATTSIVGSGGEALDVETTALAALAWLREPAYAANVERSMQWLAEVCKGGRFGSTQSTVLALRAIVAYDKARARPKAPGTVQVFVDGKPMGAPQPFTADTQGAIKLQDISEMLSPGKHTLELKMAGGAAMPYAVAVRYYATKPASSDECKVSLDVSLKDSEIVEGNVTEANVTVTNRDAKNAIPTPIAIVGLPGGLEPRHDQLKELVKSGKIDAYEVIGREVVLYWRALTPGQTVNVPLSLVAAVPGKYTGPASRAYLYYTDEFKTWRAGLTARVAPKAG